ncbi:hypothetical protein I2F31_08010 [Acinetobacter sp. EC24]|nr:hypothetical protein [Acinetobacter rathckeae]
MTHKISLETTLEMITRDESTIKAFSYVPKKQDWCEVLESPLNGVTVAIKDLIDTADWTTTYGSKAFQKNIPKKMHGL